MRLLLQKNATSGLSDALADACSKGHDDNIALLLIERSTVEDINPTFKVAHIYLASGQGYSQIVKALLDKGAHVNRDGSAARSTPLCAASANGHIAVVELLLERGADMRLPGAQGYTPLQIADVRRHSQVSEALQKEEDHRSSKGYSHLLGSDTHSVATRELLSEVGKRESPDWKQVKRIRGLILEKKADVNCKATNGWTPLHWACSEGHLEIAKLLLDNGAGKNRTIGGRGRGRGDTPLFTACRNDHLEIARLLLDNNANPDCHTGCGEIYDWAPLHWVCFHGKTDLVNLLVEHGAKVNPTSSWNKSQLFVAIEKGHLEIVTVLLRNGAAQTITHEGYYINDMNEKMRDREESAMNVAIRSGLTEIVELLLLRRSCGAWCHKTVRAYGGAYAYGESCVVKEMLV